MSISLLLLLLSVQAPSSASASAVQAPTAQAPEPAEKPASVCDLLRDLGKLNTKEVTVRGYLGGDRYLGYFLVDNADSKPCEGMPRLTKTWPPTVYLRWPGEARTEKALEEVVTRRDREAKDKKVLATFKGTFEVAKGIKIYRDLEGGYFGNAYGFTGQHPAQVVVKAVADLVVQ